MTLIASTLNSDVPFLFSDILFSSDFVNNNITIPTSSLKVNEYLNSEVTRKPAALFQKMYIPVKNVCLLMAGSEYEMRQFLEDFNIMCQAHRDEEFEKINNIAYIVWRSQYLENGTMDLPVPRLILHQHYFNDTLRIIAIEPKKATWIEQDDSIVITSENFDCKTFYVPQLIVAVEGNDKNETPLSFKTNVISQGFAVAAPNEKVFLPSLFTNNLAVRVELLQGPHLKILIHKEIMKKVKEHAMGLYDTMIRQ